MTKAGVLLLGVALTGHTASVAVESPAVAPAVAIVRSAERQIADSRLRCQVGGGLPTAAIGGFAKIAGTTGGAGYPQIRVTSDKDNGAGSLRVAARAAAAAGGGRIMFDLPAGARRIDLQSTLRLPSNLTLDGGCGGVTITSAGRYSALMLVDAKNVAILGLRIHQIGPAAAQKGDCISVRGESDRVWIAYNQLTRCGDGLIDITRAPRAGSATRVTIAFNRFADHDKAIGIGTTDCARDAECPDYAHRPWRWNEGIQVTLQNNLFLNTGQRHPRVSGLAFVHFVNNVVIYRRFRRPDGTLGASYGTFVGSGARALIERNVYVNANTDRRYAICAPGIVTCGGSDEKRPKAGAMTMIGNATVNAVGPTGHSEAAAPRVPYQLVGLCADRYSADLAQCIEDRL
ncbi:hypothetical protein M0208_11425 [Sphingomonas sp. SUN019]|uniref:pectate lyase family protein n=1 Tax=Sphingomonas sp. SUN019 TaxID=2937788 RepID=UPI002164E4F4|nr:hypothetical protein [Sphingomonas sp. SUN019]UVO51099.1 hypothetical protein M0208_11425 [Sphingomonas sp. SUN019]